MYACSLSRECTSRRLATGAHRIFRSQGHEILLGTWDKYEIHKNDKAHLHNKEDENLLQSYNRYPSQDRNFMVNLSMNVNGIDVYVFLGALCALTAYFLFGNARFIFRYLRPGWNHDYFELSGVPAPNPLPDFDIDTAKARPYRPFRWKYHQNMCTSFRGPFTGCTI